MSASGSTNKNMEVGIQTAQRLMDPRRRDQLKRQMKEQYSLIPDAVVVSCIDVAAEAFTRVAPDQLKTALRPGGIARVRPELEEAIVNLALNRSGILQNVPLLDEKDRRKFVGFIVGASLDYVLKDAQEVLAAPEVRLEALEEQTREVKRMMGPVRLFWYRVRHRAREIAVAVALSATGLLVYQKRSVPSLSLLSSIMVQLFSCLSVVGKHTQSAIGFFSKESILAFYMLKNMILRQ